jgi:hypothetical protein
MREMEEMERIESISRNLKRTYMKRLRQACRKGRTIGAELQHRTIAPPSGLHPAAEREREREREGGGGGGKWRECVTSKMMRCRRFGGRLPNPKRMAELKMTGLDDSVEVVVAVAQAGGCRIGEITVGLLRTAPRSLGSV